MAQRTNLNVAPYYSDFDPVKDFYKILFRPGYSVQARELTQIQDILQNQIENLGSGIYREGQMIIPGEYSYVNNATYIKISRITSGTSAQDYVGYTLTGEVSGVKAKVILADDANDTESVVFFVQYISSGTDNVSSRFQEGETVLSDHPDNLTAVIGVSSVTLPTVISYDVFNNSGGVLSTVTNESSAQGEGSYFTVGTGIYFIRGFMTRVESETIILSKFHTKPTGRIGFTVTESFVTPEQDSSLLDNAQGSSNFAAPGAHRFKIKTSLSFRPIDSVDENFVEIARVVNGTLQRQVQRTSYKWLWETLARRTYDESGNYIVNPFSIDLKEWINTNDQDGMFVKGTDNKYGQGTGPSPNQNSLIQNSNGTIEFDDTGKVIFNYGVISDRLTEEEADNKFIVSIGAGKAYVSGYEIESNVTDFIVADKARTTQFRDNVRNSISEGQHTYVTNTFGAPDLQNVTTGGTANAFQELRLHKTFTDGFVGLSDLNVGNECQTTYHLVTTNTTSYSVGASLGTGVVVYFASISGGSIIVLTGTSDYVIGGSIGNGVISSVYKQSAEPVGITRPKFYKVANLITDDDQKANKTSEFKLGIQSSTFFTHLYVRNSNGTPTVGKVVTGSRSRAKGIIESGSTSTILVLSNTSGVFEQGENVIDEDGAFTCTTKRLYEVDSLVITDFSNSPTSSITLTYSGQNVVLNNNTHYTKSTNGSRFTLTLTEAGRNRIYSFFGSGTPGYIQITKMDSNSGVAGYGVIVQEYQKKFSFDNVKSLFGSSDSDNEFSADFSYLNVPRTASFTISTGANYTAAAGSRYLECQDVSKDPSTEVFPGDVISVVDDSGTNRLFYVHFTTKPVGQGTVRQNGRIYVTMAVPSAITRNQIVVYRSKTNNADKNTLLFKLPTQTTSTLETVPTATDINYTIYRQFMGSLTGGNTAVFTIVTPGETFLTDPNQMILTFADSASGNNVGKFVQLKSDNVVFSDSDKKVTITLPFAAGGNYKVKLIAPVSVINARAKRKVKKTSIDISQPNYLLHKAYVGSDYDKEEISLNVVDAYKLRSVYAATGPSGNPTDPNTRTNVSERYYLKTGQTDNYYGVSSLVLKKGYQPAAGPLYVDFDYFEHSNAGDFFSVDSYTDVDGVDYGDIPTYDSEILGTVELRDCIDFRPSVNPTTSSIPLYDGVGEIGSMNFTGAESNASRIPVEFTTFDCDIENYLARKDSIFLTPIGDFVLVNGVPSERPEYPTDLSGALRLYDLSIPAYTFSAKDIVIKTYNYQRYTMKDIQSIDNRVKRLEEVVSLSLLEQNTLASQVKDAVTGLDRFKNGIVVDDFKGHVTGAAGDPEYKCSVDTINTHLRAPFYSQQLTLEESTTDNQVRSSNGYVRTGDYIHLPYTNTELLSNRNVTGSINIQPYSVFTYTGELRISPEIDEWSDITTLPENRVMDDTTFNAIAAMAGPNGVVNTTWNDWNTTWSGITQSEVARAQTLVSDAGAFTAQRFLNQVRATAGNEQVINATGGGNGHGSLTRLWFRDTIETRQTRTGIENILNVASTTRRDTNLGPRVVDVSLARFMRTQLVQFTASGLKPNTRLYGFFDGQDINDWISPDEPNQINGESVYNFAVGTRQKGFGQPIITDSFGNVQGVFLVPNGNPPKPYVKQSELTTTVNGVTTSSGVGHNSNSLQVISGVNWYNQIAPNDISKIVYYNVNQFPTTPSENAADPNFDGVGSSAVPPSRQFKVGDRMFRLTTSINDSRRDRELEAYAEKSYTANGLIQTRQNTVISTRIPQFTQRQLTDNRTITEIRENRTALQVGTWGDPVAQTFTIDENENPKGVFATGIDIFFESKSSVHGVEVYLTSTDNGRPTEIRIPGTTSNKSPDSYLRVKCVLGSGVVNESFIAGTIVTGSTSGAIGILKSSLNFQSSTQNPTTNVSNTVYDVVLSNYQGEFIPGETITFSRTTPVTSTFNVVENTVKVGQVKITNFGVGYKSLDEITTQSEYVSVQFSVPQLPGGVQATGYAKVSNGRLYDVIVTNSGSGYTSTPSITFSGGGASIGATAEVITSDDRNSVIMGVATSQGGTVPTRFNFDGPVYLENGKTYAFVVYCPTSVDYKIFVSRVGDKKLLSDGTQSQELVNKQPVLGSLFKSQNGSLWTEDQQEDVTFVLYKAQFDTTKAATVEFNNLNLPVIDLTRDPITTNSSVGTGTFFGANPSVIRVRTKAPHGLLAGDLVVIDGITGSGSTQTIGGIDISKINKQHTVLHSDFYTFDINVGANATSSVTAGGINGKCTSNLPYEVIQPQVSYLNFQETSVELSLISTIGGTIDEGYVVGSYVQDSPVSVYTGSDYYFRGPRLVANNDNEVLNSGSSLLNGKKSFRLRATFSSLNSDLSPVIDVPRTNAILVRSLVDDPDMNDDRFGPTRTLLTLSANASLPVDGYLYGVTNGTTLNGSVSRIVSYNSTTKEALIEKTDSGSIIPETNSSVYSVNTIKNTDINSTVNIGDTTITVISPHNLVTNDYIKVDNEIMKVTGTTSTTLTVTRGLFGTTDSSHAIGSDVYKLILIGTVFDNDVATITSSVRTGSVFYVPETSSDYGSSFAKFKSRTFTLENPSDQINLTMSAFLFDTNHLKCYYRTRSENDSRSFLEIPWIPFNGTGLADNSEKARVVQVDDINPSVIDRNNFFEYKYSVTGLTPFSSFELKFVFNTVNPALSPLIDDYRVICTV